jgi:hypothetical protein
MKNCTVAKMREQPIKKTRYPELCYTKSMPGLWRIVTSEDGAHIGPHYHSERELLTDLDRYARDYGVGDKA